MAVIAALKHQSGRLPDLEREFRRNQTIGTAPNPVGTEIFAAHVTPRASQAIQEALRARYHGVQGL
jgi:hypothetical protein